MKFSNPKKIAVVVICFVCAIIVIIMHKERSYIYSSFYDITARDPVWSIEGVETRSVESLSAVTNPREFDLRIPILVLATLSSFSRDSELIYEIRGMRSMAINWPTEKYEDSPLRNYSFMSYSGRVLHFFFDYENEIVPRVFHNIHGPRYVRQVLCEIDDEIIWIGLMKKEDNSSFALTNIFEPTRYYREFQWNQDNFIISFDFIDSEYIMITYIDKNKLFDFNGMFTAFRGHTPVIDIGNLNFYVHIPWRTWQHPNTVQFATSDDFYSYQSHERINLSSYINNESPIIDYRYNFINSHSLSRHVTIRNFNRLTPFADLGIQNRSRGSNSSNLTMNKDDVNRIFRVDGVLVKQYSYNGRIFEIYGYLGDNIAVFAVFYDNWLVASEFLDPRFY